MNSVKIEFVSNVWAANRLKTIDMEHWCILKLKYFANVNVGSREKTNF